LILEHLITVQSWRYMQAVRV